MLGHAFTADETPLNADRDFGFQSDADRHSWRGMTDSLAEALG